MHFSWLILVYTLINHTTDTIGTNTAEETDRLVAADTENDFHASRNITGNFEDRRDNLADTDTSGDTGPLTCLVCR